MCLDSSSRGQQREEVWAGHSKTACLSFVTDKVNGFWRLSGAAEILDFNTFRPLKSVGDGYRVSYTSILRMSCKMLVQGSYKLWNGKQH
jgi:hypothetical protein